jgi:hypothetical protein
MTFDGNPKPVQFIQPNVLDRACLSVGKHTALSINSDRAAPYSSKIFDARRFTDGIARPCRPSRLCCSKRLNGDACPEAQPPE